MADDSLIGSIPEITALDGDERMYAVDDPSGTASDGYVQVATIVNLAAAAAPVQSVAGKTGAVTLDAADLPVDDDGWSEIGSSGDVQEAFDAVDTALGGKVAASTLTTDGDLLTRASGVPARIARADLAADPAFSSQYAPHLPGPSTLGAWFAGTHQLIGTSVSHNGNRYFYFPVQLPPGTYDQMGINITTSGTGHEIRLAVYEFDSLTNLPGDRLAETGAIDASAAGALSDDLDSPLVWPGGWLFLAFAGNNNAIGFTAVGGQTLGMPSTLGSTGGACCYREVKSGSVITMPSTANPTEILETTNTSQPMVKIRQSPS